MTQAPRYRALFSTDWNECLAPCGPFDGLAHAFPDLRAELEALFRAYTGNRLTLEEAARQVAARLPAPMGAAQMDAYLAACFRTYTGVPELMAWCADQGVLCMVNTTGMTGYFQRALALGLVPPLPVLSAHPLVRFPAAPTDPRQWLPLTATADKGRHTEQVAREHGIPFRRVVVMGDSGGDGPHMAWGAARGALLVGSMTKLSLETACRAAGIALHHRFGVTYAEGQPMDRQRELAVDFMGLTGLLQETLER
jgi:hypothetical protein